MLRNTFRSTSSLAGYVVLYKERRILSCPSYHGGAWLPLTPCVLPSPFGLVVVVLLLLPPQLDSTATRRLPIAGPC